MCKNPLMPGLLELFTIMLFLGPRREQVWKNKDYALAHGADQEKKSDHGQADTQNSVHKTLFSFLLIAHDQGQNKVLLQKIINV
ncbi:MAG: hypothetical protein HUN05_16135 [Desulfobacter sp.]|nr:MAG: hypothetical protein HUN05_16135 [Desulfobacter sp.]